MKVGIIGAGTMGQGIAKAFAQVDGYQVALCDIKQEWAEGGKAKIAKGYDRLVQKGKLTQEAVDAILAKITPGLKDLQPFYHRNRQRTYPSNDRYAFLQPGRPYEISRSDRRRKYTG